MNYNKISKKRESVSEKQLSPIVPIENEEPAIEPVEEQVYGVVNCAKLNVRVEPDKNAEVEAVIVESTKLLIDESESTDEFYKICNEYGLEGFCMKKFITIL